MLYYTLHCQYKQVNCHHRLRSRTHSIDVVFISHICSVTFYILLQSPCSLEFHKRFHPRVQDETFSTYYDGVESTLESMPMETKLNILRFLLLPEPD